MHRRPLKRGDREQPTHRYGVGRASNALKHNQIPKLRQLIPLSVFPCFLMLLIVPIHFVFLIPFVGWFSLCLAYGALLALRSHSLTNLLSGVIAATMHFGWSVGFCKQLITHKLSLVVGQS